MRTKTVFSALASLSVFSALISSFSAFAETDVPNEELLQKCNQKPNQDESSCVRNTLAGFINHTLKTVPYGTAKSIIFRKIDVYTTENGQHAVDSVYSPDVWLSGGTVTERVHRSDNVTFNIEHTWPQSKLKPYPRFEQTKADMFHLFPVETRINSERGNYPFVDCHDNSQNSQERVSAMCDGGFQPPALHRGKVARAMFYMAVTYNMKIDAAQEAVLRQWNESFPVTDVELARDAAIYEVQGVHNPFILHPEWVSRISDF